MTHDIIETDFIVIGSGIAGLSFAIQAAEYGQVVLITKKQLMESNTNLAQGGIAAVQSSLDSFDLHIADTLRVGCGLCIRNAVEILVAHGPQAINWLIDQGVEFDERQGTLALSMESGHSRRRIAHKGDYTGREIEKALVDTVKQLGASIYENCLALELLVSNQQCYGVRALRRQEQTIITFHSKVTAS